MLEKLTDVAVVSAVLGAFIGGAFALVNRLIDYYTSRREHDAEADKLEAEADKTDQETIQIQRSTILGLIRDNEDYRQRLVKLEDRLDQHERENREKEAELKALRDENEALKTNIDELKSAFKDLLQYMKDIGIEIPKEKLPRPGLLETDPRMKAVNGRKK